MGTTYAVKLVAPPLSEQSLFEVRLAIEAAFDNVDRKMSTYREDSELSRFNDVASTEPFPVSAETLEVFRRAREASEATGGAFDVTVGPFVALWGFGADSVARDAEPRDLPSQAEVEAIGARVGWRLIEVNEAASTIAKKDPTVRCDLSAIAKGYAVDRAAEALTAKQFDNFMVELGGEIRTAGVNERGTKWVIAIERPVVEVREPRRLLEMSGMALATSGDYRNYYEKDGRRYSHTIDPRNGRPVAHQLASVSVFDPLAARADAYATALMVLGDEEGFLFAAKHDLAALFLVRDGSGGFLEKSTPRFEELFGGMRNHRP